MCLFKNRKDRSPKKSNLIYSYPAKSINDEDIDGMSVLLSNLYKVPGEIVFLCIGTDRSTGDSLGPFVGTMLKENEFPYPIYGTIAEPVQALNIQKVLNEIERRFTNPTIFSVDACLGDHQQIESIRLYEGPLVPRGAINNRIPKVGNYHLKVVVNYQDPLDPINSLNTTRLDTVLNLAKITSTIILKSVEE